MFNVDLKSPELSMRAAAAGSSRKSQAPDLRREYEGGGSWHGGVEEGKQTCQILLCGAPGR